MFLDKERTIVKLIDFDLAAQCKSNKNYANDDKIIGTVFFFI